MSGFKFDEDIFLFQPSEKAKKARGSGSAARELDITSMEEAERLWKKGDLGKKEKKKVVGFVTKWLAKKLGNRAGKAADFVLDNAGFKKADELLEKKGKGKAGKEILRSMIADWGTFSVATWALNAMGVGIILNNIITTAAWKAFLEALKKRREKKRQEKQAQQNDNQTFHFDEDFLLFDEHTPGFTTT